MTVADRVQKHRNRLRESGLRPVQLWVPDTRSTDFTNEIKRQSAIVNQADNQDEIMEWIEDISVGLSE